MNSPSSTSLFARKGQAAPTPVPEDVLGPGFAGRLSGQTDLPVEESASTIVAFNPATSSVGDAAGNAAEAGSMLGIPLAPRRPAATPSLKPKPLPVTDEPTPPGFASVAVMPLADRKAMTVIDGSRRRGPRARAGRRRRLNLLLAAMAAILAGVILYVFFVGRGAQPPDSAVTVSVSGPETAAAVPAALPATESPATLAPPVETAEKTTIPVEIDLRGAAIPFEAAFVEPEAPPSAAPVAPVAAVTPSAVSPSAVIPATEPPAIRPAAAISEIRSAPAPKPIRPYSVQLASLPNARDAERELRTLKRRHGSLLAGLDLRVMPGVAAGKGRVWRIRASGMPSAELAQRACRRLSARKIACLVIRRR